MTKCNEGVERMSLNVDVYEDLEKALSNLIAAHLIALDGRREVHIEFWEQAVSQTCKRVAEAQAHRSAEFRKE